MIIAKKELAFRKSYAKQLNSRAINDNPAKKSNFIVYSDASASGCGAHLDLIEEEDNKLYYQINKKVFTT